MTKLVIVKEKGQFGRTDTFGRTATFHLQTGWFDWPVPTIGKGLNSLWESSAARAVMLT